jgi:DNA repair protein RecN (Recombination protein N)
MLRRLALRDFVIVTELEVDLAAGFSVLTGETGAGKSILIDALQLALGSRGDAAVVREGATRSEITAEFDTPASLKPWLEEAGFDAEGSLLLRRSIDTQGKSRAWVNGSSATITQLREAADHLVDIHGQHAWQSLTRAASVRGLLDTYAKVDATAVNKAWTAWRAADQALQTAKWQQDQLERERERLAWQIAEVDKLAPGADEWPELNGEHQKLSHAQALIDAAQQATQALSEGPSNAQDLNNAAIDHLQDVAGFDVELKNVIEVLQSAQAQLQDAAHSLSNYLNRTDVEPQRLQELDERLSAWMSLARRYRRPPQELPTLLASWKAELQALDAASDAEGLATTLAQAHAAFKTEAARLTAARQRAAPALADAITLAMQQLGMAGGRFEVLLTQQDSPQSWGLESAEFLVAGHEGSTPRPLTKVASGGELSRLALAVAITTTMTTPEAQAQNSGHEPSAGTLIFDEIDSGVGGAVADTVGRLMKQLGVNRQVLAVTHLPQVAACADQHFVVAKSTSQGRTSSDVKAVHGETRVAEIARMLGGQQLSTTSLAHAQEMLSVATETPSPSPSPAAGKNKTPRTTKP